jgi:hypothetical protein
MSNLSDSLGKVFGMLKQSAQSVSQTLLKSVQEFANSISTILPSAKNKMGSIVNLIIRTGRVLIGNISKEFYNMLPNFGSLTSQIVENAFNMMQEGHRIFGSFLESMKTINFSKFLDLKALTNMIREYNISSQMWEAGEEFVKGIIELGKFSINTAIQIGLKTTKQITHLGFNLINGLSKTMRWFCLSSKEVKENKFLESAKQNLERVNTSAPNNRSLSRLQTTQMPGRNANRKQKASLQSPLYSQPGK